MRNQTLLQLAVAALAFGAGMAKAATLEVSVVQSSNEPERYTFPLTRTHQTLDLRESGRYTVAVKDRARKKDICRDAEYKTGVLLTLREVVDLHGGRHKIEVVGQDSSLVSLEEKGRLDCGVNMDPVIANKAFSDTSVIAKGKTKVIVVDGKTTLLLTVLE